MGTGTGIEYLCVSSSDLSNALGKLTSNKNAPFLLVDKDTGALLTATVSAPKSTDYGLSQYRNTALTNTAVAVKASAGNVFGVRFTNTNPSAVFVKFYDIAQGSVTVGTSSVSSMIAIPGGSVANPGLLWLTPNSMPIFSRFATAISMAATANMADNDNTAPTSAINATVLYV